VQRPPSGELEKQEVIPIAPVQGFANRALRVCRTTGDNSQARDRPQGGSVLVGFIDRVMPRSGFLWIESSERFVRRHLEFGGLDLG
jgi:hypothetical protein